jgi:hypothetical protein
MIFAMTEGNIIRFCKTAKLTVLAALLALAACAGGEPLAEAKGPWRALNAGYWTPTAADLNPQIQARQ